MKKVSNIEQLICTSVDSGQLINADLVQIIELCGQYLNIMTIPKYANEHGLTYNGVKKTRNIVEIFVQKFVIDNE